jgi:hypothetical protein
VVGKAAGTPFARGARRSSRCRRSEKDWGRRVALAERLGSHADPAAHGADRSSAARGQPFNQLSREARAVLKEADVVLSLDAIDLGGVLRQAYGRGSAPARIIHAGLDLHLHTGWGKEHMELAPIDVHLLADPDAAVADLLEALPGPGKRAAGAQPVDILPEEKSEGVNLRKVALALAQAAGGQPVTFACSRAPGRSTCGRIATRSTTSARTAAAAWARARGSRSAPRSR